MILWNSGTVESNWARRVKLGQTEASPSSQAGLDQVHQTKLGLLDQVELYRVRRAMLDQIYRARLNRVRQIKLGLLGQIRLGPSSQADFCSLLIYVILMSQPNPNFNKSIFDQTHHDPLLKYVELSWFISFRLGWFCHS